VFGHWAALLRVLEHLAKHAGAFAVRDAFDYPETLIVSPSPLNGERAGVRGVTDLGVPLARRILFSSQRR
jgi:hypothetical protein